MVWTTRSLDRKRDYVVIKHKLRDMNGTIAGVKFRGGYAVVEKDSKTYKQIKSLPLIKHEPEFPLLHLRKLPFVTRTLDVKIIYGQDVYRYYLEQLMTVLEEEKLQREADAEVQHVVEHKGCAFRSKDGDLCKFNALVNSPSNYCRKHVLYDPKLEELGIKVPKRLTSKEKVEWKDRIIGKLESLLKK